MSLASPARHQHLHGKFLSGCVCKELGIEMPARSRSERDVSDAEMVRMVKEVVELSLR